MIGLFLTHCIFTYDLVIFRILPFGPAVKLIKKVTVCIIKLYKYNCIRFHCFQSSWVFDYVNVASEAMLSGVDQWWARCLTCTERLIAFDKTRQRSADQLMERGFRHGHHLTSLWTLVSGHAGRSRYRVSAVSCYVDYKTVKDNKPFNNFAALREHSLILPFVFACIVVRWQHIPHFKHSWKNTDKVHTLRLS